MQSTFDYSTKWNRVAGILGGVLSPEDQWQMSDYVFRLLTSIDQAEAT